MAIVFPNNTLTDVGQGRISYPGTMIQTVEERLTQSTSFNNWSSANALGSASITPTSSSSLIMVYVNTSFRFDAPQGTWALAYVWCYNTTSSREVYASGWNGTWRHVIGHYSRNYLDSPASTATQTYSLRLGNYPSNGTFHANLNTAHDGYSYIRLTEYAP